MPTRSAAPSLVAEVFRTVERLRTQGEEILLLIGSDHGHETIGDGVDLEDWLAGHGLADRLASGDVAVAGQGTAALLYATERGRAGLLGVLDDMRAALWADGVVVGDGLADRGFAARGAPWRRQHGAPERRKSLRRSRPALGGFRGRQASACRQRPAWRLGAG